jgi:hypothetical protein
MTAAALPLSLLFTRLFVASGGAVLVVALFHGSDPTARDPTNGDATARDLSASDLGAQPGATRFGVVGFGAGLSADVVGGSVVTDRQEQAVGVVKGG